MLTDVVFPATCIGMKNGENFETKNCFVTHLAVAEKTNKLK